MIANAISVLIFICYDTSFSKVLPTWLYILAVSTMFFYQTLDAIDGKQARRTKTSGPLGQLFDHGCDAMTVSLATLIYYQAALVGREPDLMSFFFLFTTSHLTFYLAQWEE